MSVNRVLKYLLKLVIYFYVHSNLFAQSPANPDEVEQSLEGEGVTKSSASEVVRFLDYDTLDHRMVLNYLRAGNHNESGTQNYHFEVSLIALHDTESDHLMDMDSRKKLVHSYSAFGYLTIRAFKHLQSAEDKQLATLEIKGDAVREIVREAMNKWHSADNPVSEKEIGVQLRLELIDEHKKYYIWNSINKIIEKTYFIVPFKAAEQKLYEDMKISLTDDRGLQVEIDIEYPYSPLKLAGGDQS